MVHWEGTPTGFGKSVYNSMTGPADTARQHSMSPTYWRLSRHSWRSGTSRPDWWHKSSRDQIWDSCLQIHHPQSRIVEHNTIILNRIHMGRILRCFVNFWVVLLILSCSYGYHPYAPPQPYPEPRHPQGVGRDEILIVSDDRVLALRPTTRNGPQQQRYMADNTSIHSLSRWFVYGWPVAVNDAVLCIRRIVLSFLRFFPALLFE